MCKTYTILPVRLPSRGVFCFVDDEPSLGWGCFERAEKMLAIHRNEHLPPLSWCLVVNGDNASVVCGQCVEAGDEFFLEGAWASEFSRFDFLQCENVFGSGGRLTAEGWVVVSPSHSLEAIYILKRNDGDWYASNSLAFLLASSKADIQFKYSSLAAFMWVVEGIDHSPQHIRVSNGVLSILHHHNALLGVELSVRQKARQARPFLSFFDYRDHLQSVVKATAANASDPARRGSYRLVASVSSGYDSPACAAIARSCGCLEGFTVDKSRDGELDDGTEIGELLGLGMTRIQHPMFSHATPEASLAAEFFATGMQGEDIWYSAFDCLRGAVLVSGFHGDRIWSRDAEASAVLKRGDLSGGGLGEFRLRQNFVHLPLAFVGAREHSEIKAISNHHTMQEWSVGGGYDRPIPRRIVEEAGIPRSLFGQNKLAISTQGWRIIPRDMQDAIDKMIRAQPVLGRAHYIAQCLWFNAALVLHGQAFRGQYKMPTQFRPLYRRLWSVALRCISYYPFPIFQMIHPIGKFNTRWSMSVVADRYAMARPHKPIVVK